MGSIVIKKIDQLLLRSFITTFISILALVLFVLVTQHFFILLSHIVGKGLGIDIYTKLLFYIALSLFPSSFPIAILVTSLIVFGNLSESFELTAMRSVGLSLQRILRVPFIFVLFLSGTLFYFQDYIHPTTKHKIFALVYDVCEKKSDLFIQEGIFCRNIPGYTIRVEKKLYDNGKIEKIIIYDYTKKYGPVVITTAEKGRLYTTPDKKYLVMELTNGHNYVEAFPDQENNQSFYRNTFLRQKVNISLEALQLGNTDLKFTYDPKTRTHTELKKMIQERAQKVVDEISYEQKLIAQQAIRYHAAPQEQLGTIQMGQQYNTDDPLAQNTTPDFISFRNQLLEGKNIQYTDKQLKKQNYLLIKGVVQKTLANLAKIKSNLITQIDNKLQLKKHLNEASFEKAQRLAIAIRCVIMFLLAAPLGCIIRRGGFGVSVMISFFFILVEYLLSIFGKEWAISGSLSTFIGAWLANFTLLFFCFFFLCKAQQSTGLSLTNWHAIRIIIKKLIKNKIFVNTRQN